MVVGVPAGTGLGNSNRKCFLEMKCSYQVVVFLLLLFYTFISFKMQKQKIKIKKACTPVLGVTYYK